MTQNPKKKAVRVPKGEKLDVVKVQESSTTKLRKECALFIRYRYSKPPARDEVRLLHPAIIDVRYPRQKTARFCHVEFESKEAALKALEDIKKKHGKDLTVLAFRSDEPSFTENESPQKAKKKSPKKTSETPKLTSTEKTSPQKSDQKISKKVSQKPAPTEKELPLKKDLKKNGWEITPGKKQSVKMVSKSPGESTTACPTPKKKKLASKTEKTSGETPEKSNTDISNDGGNTTSTCLQVTGLPLIAAEEVLRSIFPKSSLIKVRTSKGKRTGLVHFQSVEETTEAMEAAKGVSVNGELLTVAFLK